MDVAPHLKFAAYLAALEDPARGGDVWDLLAPAALLPAGGGVARKVDLDRATYAAAFEADAAMAARVRPGRARGPLVAGLREVGSGWFEAEEARTGEPLRFAVGYQDGLIEWATLAPPAAAWTPEEGRAQCYADLPYGKGIYPRSWIDMAWQRLHGHARPPLLLLPEAAFACAGSTDCCRIDWAIEADAGFQHLIDAIPWADRDAHLKGIQLPATDAGKLAVKDEGKPCRFLDADGRCAIHRTLGRQPIPPCALFPFAFAQTPDGLAFSTSARCGAARQGLGPKLGERLDDLYDRLAIAANPPLRTPVYRIAGGADAGWPAFKAAEAALLMTLADETRPLATRLWRGGLLLASAAAGGEPAPPEAAPPEPLPVPGPHREAVRAFLAPWLAHLGLPDAPVLEPSPEDPAETALLVRILRNLHHAKVLSFHFDLATSHAMGVAIWLLALHLRRHHGRVPPAGWDALGVMFMHGAGLQAYLGDAPEARERRAMLGDPGFALWLTGYGV